jgi:hypothetical protein
METSEMQAFVTDNYYPMQTLRFAPLFIGFIIAPWWPHLSTQTLLLVLFISLLVCAGWYWTLTAYFLKRYGRMEIRPVPNKSMAVVTVIVIVPALLYGLFAYGSFPAGIGALFLPCGILSQSFITPNLPSRRWLYRCCGIFLVLLSLAALVKAMPGHQFLVRHLVSILSLDFAVMLGLAILDHILLIRTFRSISLQASHV